MVIEERVNGTLCRVHLDEQSAHYSAQWILSDNGEIQGLMIIDNAGAVFKEFGAWVQVQVKPLRLKTSIRSVRNIVKRFGFVEMERK